MKKSALYVCLMGLLLSISSCTDESAVINSVTNDQPVVVNFQLALRQEISSFPLTKNMPEGLPADPMTKSDTDPDGGGDSQTEPATPTTEITRIEYALYRNDDNSLVKHQSITPQLGENGEVLLQVKDGITPGTYKACFVAHAVTAATFSETTNLLTFPTIKDTFWGTDEIEITVTDNDQTIDVTLKRVIAGIEFCPIDAVPAEVQDFTISSSGYYNTLSILDGNAGSTTLEIPYTHQFTTDEYAADARISHILYTFVPNTDAAITTMTLAARGESELVVRQKVIRQVPIYRNKITRYTGTLYTPNVIDTNFNLNIDGNWEEAVEKNLDEV